MAELSLEGLQPDVTYAVEQADLPDTTWQSIGQVSESTVWTTNLPTSDPARFYRSVSTDRVERLVLPVSP